MRGISLLVLLKSGSAGSAVLCLAIAALIISPASPHHLACLTPPPFPQSLTVPLHAALGAGLARGHLLPARERCPRARDATLL